MSLGIESEDFQRVFANELSPMAASTYAYNLIHEKKPDSDDPEDWYTRLYAPDKNGKYGPDPRAYLNKRVTKQAKERLGQFSGGMFVGGINQLNQALRSFKRKALVDLDLDVLSGGPPCQSFSLAGQRDRGNPRNDLPFEFAKCAALLYPKIVLLENVSGILRAFKDPDGHTWHAWYEVAKAFHGEGYVPICTHAEAEKYGVPQKRPRFVMVAIRKDIALKAIKCLGEHSKWKSTREVIEKTLKHFDRPSENIWSGPDDFKWLEPGKNWPGELLPLQLDKKDLGVCNIIDGLTKKPKRLDLLYIRKLTKSYDKIPASKIPPGGKDEDKNLEPRNHSSKVEARFRLLRLLSAHKRKPVDNQQLMSLSEEDKKWLCRKKLIFPGDDSPRPRKIEYPEELDDLLEELRSKKHSQRALLKNKVAPAQLSIPDDCVHYAEDRTLSVREMARIQSFPDWFEFKAKVTTGGHQRAYEVPRYTQVGNAVPPLMAKQIAKGIREFLEIIEE